VNDRLIKIHGFDTRDHVLYDFDGHPSHIAHGALLETVRIAATRFGLQATWTICSSGDDRAPVYDVHLTQDSSIKPDDLLPFIETRTVQRRPMRLRPLTDSQKQAMSNAAGNAFKVEFFELPKERFRVARLLWKSAKIRLTCPEAYLVHREIIEWKAKFSKHKIPEQAVGVDPITARLMEWAMHSWARVDFLNRFLLGTVLPRIQLDFLPGFFCAAHLLVRPTNRPVHLSDWITLGAATQRIWLVATQHGLQFQPQMTPVIFRWYARANRSFTKVVGMPEQVQIVADEMEAITSTTAHDHFGFFARVGVSKMPESRSTRLDMRSLVENYESDCTHESKETISTHQ